MYYLLRSCIPCHINTQTHIQLLILLENRLIAFVSFVLQWRHNERDALQIISLTIVYLTIYSRRISKKASKLRVTGLCTGNSPVTD